jgi:hypothetical protein
MSGSMGPLIVFIGGGVLVAYLVYDWMQYRLRMRMRRESKEQGLAKRVSYDWKVYAMIGLTILMAVLYGRPISRQDPIPLGYRGPVTETTGYAFAVALYILVVGVWWAIRQARKEQVSERMLINLQVSELVSQFRSVFRIRPTVFSALEEANKKIPPPTGSAVNHAVTTFYVTALPRRALDELRARVDNPYLDQFIYILERGEDAKHEDIMTALEGLMVRLRRAREIRDQSEVNLTVVTGQTRIIQMIAVALVFVVGVVPTLRLPYESAIGQAIFLFFATIGVVTSWYIDSQSTKLKEKVL